MKETDDSAALARQYGLEAIPECVARLTELVARQDADLDHLAKVISQDPELTSRLLRAANPRSQDESEYGVTTVDGALMRNGVGCVLVLAMVAPLVRAVVKTFQTMLSLKAELINPRSADPIVEEHVLAAIRFSGKAVGGVQVRLRVETARWIAATLLGVPPDELTDPAALSDAIGELANIIAGNLKSNLCDAGLECALGAPRISRTTEFRAKPVAGGSLERMAFRASQFVFFVDLTVNPWSG